ncbi:carbohydrate sulfotransferase 9-like [Gigantopelta aegis]|uniref:carbohydrate sulfotransferase 9-like n=1 Tax=Gigantopelta aegis TaxID=1735272 RepID=UPI001B8880A0|nr:carbohydrate sulfotransferase 9-like [Gigantopelta aegis]
MFHMHVSAIRRRLARLRLRHFVMASLPFLTIAFILVYLSRENVFSSNSWSPSLKDPHPTYSSSDVQVQMEHRREHAQEACKRPREAVSWFTLAIVVFRPLKLAFCHVPKSGTTIWTSVYRYLNQDLFPGYLKNPFQMRKFYVHHTKMRHFETLDIFHEGHGYLDTSFNVLFVRDPYSRLYSVYLEKLYLPDMWNDLGVEIVKRFRPSATKRSRLCGNDVTFVEFIQYVVQSGNEPLESTRSRVAYNQSLPPVWNQVRRHRERRNIFKRRRVHPQQIWFN